MSNADRSKIEPTLFIGLGGAGGRILGLLRRSFDEQFGKISGAESPVQFLLLDTDDFQKLDPSVREPLDEQEDFLSISHFNPRQYIDQHRRDHRSDLHRWFDWETRPLLDDAFVRDGASRLRILGRLCFHRSYFEIEKILSNKIALAKSARAYVDGGGPLRTTERPFRVMVIGSSCGGTGSAIFLDLVHLINRLVRESGATPDVLGFAFLPFWFIEANRRIDTDLVPYYQSNAWAFFEELNHVLLQPSRLADFALDPRRPNGADPDPVVADYEPLKTVYLLDAEIPNIGRFQDPGDWNAYIAQSIFQVFLAPEEGNLESVYSNIKTKLAETDHRYGLRKRFAAIGYADLRHPGERLRKFLAIRATVEYTQDRLLCRADGPEVATAAGQLQTAIQAAIQQPVTKLANADIELLQLSNYTKALGPTKLIAKTPALTGVAGDIDKSVSVFNAALPTAPELDAVVAQVNGLVAARCSELTLGFAGELEVLRRVFDEMRPGSASPPAVGDRIAVVAASLDGVSALVAEASAKKKFFGLDNSSEPSTYIRLIERANDDLKDRVAKYKADRAQAIETELRQRIIGVLQGDTWHDPRATTTGAVAESVLGRARTLLERAHADLQGVSAEFAQGALGDLASHQSLTARYFPPVQNADDTWAAFRTVYGRVVQSREHDLRQAVQALAADLRDASGNGDRRDRVSRALATLGGFFLGALDVSTDVVDGLEAARQQARERAGRGDPHAERELQRLTALQHNLYALSTPCCRIDRNRLSPGDSMPTVFIAAAKRREDEVQQLLHLPTAPGVIDNDGSQLSLLQAVYAFSTQAVAGMDALRQAYETRDHARSFPHLLREWNRTGLRVSRQSELDDAELLQFARARALSIRFGEAAEPDGNGAGAPPPDHNGAGSHGRRIRIPGLHVYEGPHGTGNTFWLLRYERNPRDGRYYLQARDVERIDGRHRTWRLSDAVEELQPLALDMNVRTYMASPLRWSHHALLEELEEVERSQEGGAFREAYREFALRLRDLAAKHATAGDRGAERLHQRMAQALDDYLVQLESRDVLVP